MNRFVKLAVFGVLGPIVIGLLYFSLMNQAATTVTRDLTSSMQRQSAAVTERAKARQTDAARQAAEVQRAQLEAKDAQARSDMEAARLAQLEATRKEAAWKLFFKPKKACDDPQDWDTQVECGNAHMRAKRHFNARWARGEFQQP